MSDHPSAWRAGALALCLLFSAWLSLPERGTACASVGRERNAVTIADESAIVVWDAATKTQHFIRRAQFDTDASDFGFLVPTPTKPYLGEAKNEAFSYLETVTAPEVKTEVIEIRRNSKSDRVSLGEKAPSVRVLDAQIVAGLEAVVLEASDAKALNDWLKKHGYLSSPALTAWLDTYVKQKWILTAFKYARKPDGSREVSTAAVRMTFQAERPYFPYREPADQRDQGKPSKGGRMLRVFYVGDARVAGQIGDGSTFWPGRTVWANKLSSEQKKSLSNQLGVKLPGKETNPWLTVLEDASSPRPGTDELFLARSDDQSTVARPPIIHYVYRDAPVAETDSGSIRILLVGGGVVLGLGAMLALLLWRMGRA